MATDRLPREARELFGVAPKEFVKARDALARRLAGAGRRDDAEAVAGLRRPTEVVWAINQVASGRNPDLRLISRIR